MIDVRRAGERFTTTTDWLTSRHSFSFGPHYDPDNVGLAVLVAHNEDAGRAGARLRPAPARRPGDRHLGARRQPRRTRTRTGTRGVLAPGRRAAAQRGQRRAAQRAQRRPRRDEPTRFVQMWLRPDEAGLDPSYAQQRRRSTCTGLTPLASGVPGLDAAVRIAHRGGGAARRPARCGRVGALPDAPRLHVFVARGAVDLEGAGRLSQGDAARFTADGAQATGAQPTASGSRRRSRRSRPKDPGKAVAGVDPTPASGNSRRPGDSGGGNAPTRRLWRRG